MLQRYGFVFHLDLADWGTLCNVRDQNGVAYEQDKNATQHTISPELPPRHEMMFDREFRAGGPSPYPGDDTLLSSHTMQSAPKGKISKIFLSKV